MAPEAGDALAEIDEKKCSTLATQEVYDRLYLYMTELRFVVTHTKNHSHPGAPFSPVRVEKALNWKRTGSQLYSA
jgi:hypothetical protein